jgi:hypothetical protein
VRQYPIMCTLLRRVLCLASCCICVFLCCSRSWQCGGCRQAVKQQQQQAQLWNEPDSVTLGVLNQTTSRQPPPYSSRHKRARIRLSLSSALHCRKLWVLCLSCTTSNWKETLFMVLCGVFLLLLLKQEAAAVQRVGLMNSLRSSSSFIHEFC